MTDPIAKFTVRFRYEDKGELSSIDTKICKHLKELTALGGHAEWMRNAIRNQYILEQAALSKEQGKKEGANG